MRKSLLLVLLLTTRILKSILVFLRGGPGLGPAPGIIPIPARLLRARAEWERIGAWDLLQQGIRAEWADAQAAEDLRVHPTPPQYQPRGPLREVYRRLLQEELTEGVIAPVPATFPKLRNPTFLVPKKGGKFRKVVDCRLLNEHLRDKTFKMEGIGTVREMVKPGDWATSLDFKNAFNHIPVHADLQPYLCFDFEGTTYGYRGMPFGVKHAPRVFSRLMKRAIQEVRRRWGVRISFYMDDTLLLFTDEQTAAIQTAEIAGYLQRLGWTLSPEKCQFRPSQVTEFLGWEWNLRNATLAISPSHRGALLEEVFAWLDLTERRSQVSIRKLASLLGELNFLRAQNPEASLYTGRLNALKVHSVRASGWDGHTTVTPAVAGELKWWLRRISRNPATPMLPPPVRATLTTDASPDGWGGVIEHGEETRIAFGRWRGSERLLTSNAKELTAVRKALEDLAQVLDAERGGAVLVRSDNTTTVQLIRKWRAAATLLPHLRRLWNLSGRMELHLTATYLPGVHNERADRLSRMGNAMDYAVKQDIFPQILQQLRLQPQVDVFADSHNHLLDAYCTLDATDGGATAVDGMLLDWTGQVLWLHPPILLIGVALTKLRREGAQAILVVPDWSGQTWSHDLTQLSRASVNLGAYEQCMTPGRRFLARQWKFPPGQAVAHSLDTRTTVDSSSSSGTLES
jgi:ribonuclease HI